MLWEQLEEGRRRWKSRHLEIKKKGGKKQTAGKWYVGWVHRSPLCVCVYWASGWAAGAVGDFLSRLLTSCVERRAEILRVFLQRRPPFIVSSPLLAHYWHSFRQPLITPSCYKLGVAACFPHCIHAHVTATMPLQNAWPWATGSWCNPSIHADVVGWEGSRQTACFWLSSGPFDRWPSSCTASLEPKSAASLVFHPECLCLWGQNDNETDPHLCSRSNVTSVSKASYLHTSWLHLLEVRLLPRINGHKILRNLVSFSW